MDVLAFVLQAITQDDGTIIFQMLSEPVLMAAKECLNMANEINNNADLPQIVMCMPPIIEPGLPV